MFKSKGFPKFWMLIPALLLGIACSKPPPSRRYYTLDYPIRKVKLEGSGRPYPFKVQLRRFEVLRMYDRSQIVFRYSPNELQYYQYKNWAMKPGDLITDRVEAHLVSANLFDELRREFLDSYPDYRIEGTVHALEKLEGGDIFFARLAMTFRLIREEDRKEIWRHEFDDRKKVYEPDMVYAVIALREILETQATHVVKELDRVFQGIMGLTGKEPSVVPEGATDTERPSGVREILPPKETAPAPKVYQKIPAKRDTVHIELPTQ